MVKRIFWAINKWWSDVSGSRSYLRYLEKEDRRRRLAGQFSTFLTIPLGFLYLGWHWQHINWDVWYYSFPFFLAEGIGLLLFSFFAFNSWFLRYHAPEGVALEKAFSVDVFIPVAGEPIDLVKETVEAAIRIDFQNKRIYILDDKENEEYKKLAEANGCGYFAREDHSNAKAGNLNYAFQRTNGDLIIALDADQVPHPQIINRLIGYFKFPKVAFVQTKQNFKVPIGDPFGNTDRIFYNVMQSGKDNDNSAFSCGSGVIYRRGALEEIGGFSTWNLVEDVHTSMLLHERGWRSVYYNHPLTRGTAPIDIHGVYRQRRQWAADSLRMLFWDSPFRRSGLTFKQKLQYFNLGFVYLVSAFVMPIFFITPVWALLTENFILTAPVADYVLHRFPYFIAMSVAYGILNYPTPYMKAYQMWTGLFPAFIQATWIALLSRKKKPSYRVNVKPVGQAKVKTPWLAIWPQTGIIALSLFSLVYVFIVGSVAWDFYLLNFVWALWSMWTMSEICLAAIKKHKWPKEDALEEKKPPSFFSKTRELLLTVILSILIVIFFTVVDALKINQFMSRLRLDVLHSLHLEKPVVDIDQEIPKITENSRSVLRKVIEAPPVAKQEAVAKAGEWAVQVISVRTQKRAALHKEQLMAAGFSAYTVPGDVNGQEWIRVRVGFFGSEEEAQEVGRRIQRSTSIADGPYWIMKVPAEEKDRLHGN
jgi:cellulose synthase (UDP-forming)